jgi:gamma-glutamyltranspeptidase/glutathione hydrolase
MTPTIVVKDGRPFILVGGRGGSRIPTAVASVLINVIDFGMNIREAVASPRIHHQWLPDEIHYETHGLAPSVIEQLQKRGWTVKDAHGSNGRVQAIMIEPATGMRLGGPDRREHGIALGY